MSGAAIAASPVERARLALTAGCDMGLICNDRPAAVRVLDELKHAPNPLATVRLMRMHGRPFDERGDFRIHPRRAQALLALEQLNAAPTLALGDDTSA